MDASPAPPPRTTRKQRADETRLRVFTAATRLFAKHGYHATTIDRIAAEAGVAKGTFFVHFRSKDAVISELVTLQTRAAREARAHLLATEGPLAALRGTVMALAEQASLSRSLSRGVLSAILESQEAGGAASTLFEAVFGDMSKDAHAAKRAGSLAPGVDAGTLAASLMAAYLGGLVHFASSRHTKPLTELIAPLVDATFAGALATPRSRKPKPRSGTKKRAVTH